MSTAVVSKRRRSDVRVTPAPTLGPWVCAWIEKYLVHGSGDYYGQPFRLRPWQRALIWRAYELFPDGSRRYRRALWGLPKGNGKTELAAAIALAEFAGPVVFAGWREEQPLARARLSPDIPVAATSYTQTDLLFGAAKMMVQAGPLHRFCDAFDTQIAFKDGRPGKFYRVASVAGSNDGGKPSFVVGDELHEWTGRKERLHLVLSNGCTKREDAWELAISTAGWDVQSLLGRMYTYGQRVAEGKVDDPAFMFEWRAASKAPDLTDARALERAIREANPAADDFLPLKNVMRRAQEIPEHEFLRYHLNMWSAAPDRWIDADLWAKSADDGTALEPGAEVTLGFDGSYNRDSTALVAASLGAPSRLRVLGLWERPAEATDWKVPRDEVLAAIDDALATYRVASMGADDTFGRIWAMDLEALAAKGVDVVEWPTRSLARMAPASAAFYGALKDGRLTHDGHSGLARHVANCVQKLTRWGPVPTKVALNAPQRIDAAIAAVVAHDMAVRSRAAATGWLLT